MVTEWCGMGNRNETPPSATVERCEWGRRELYSCDTTNIEIFTNVGKGEEADVMVVAGQHPREWNSLLIAQTFVASMESNDVNVKLVVVPNANPIGLDRSTSGNRMQRCNGRNVDLNRNFPTKHFQSKASGVPWTNGERGGSEPETQILMKVIETYKPRTVLNLHCYGRLIVLPHSYTSNLPAQWPTLHKYAELMQQEMKKTMDQDYEILPFRKIYEGHGPLMEWCYEQNITCFTFEFGKSFTRDDETVRGGTLALWGLIQIAARMPHLGDLKKGTRKELQAWKKKEHVNVPYRGYLHLQCIGMKRK